MPPPCPFLRAPSFCHGWPNRPPRPGRRLEGGEGRADGDVGRERGIAEVGTEPRDVLARLAFGLGIEALERFVREEPLHRVHECVFGVLALESEPVDPRL